MIRCSMRQNFNKSTQLNLHSLESCMRIACLFACLQADAATWDLHRSGCCYWSRPAWQPRPLVVSPNSSVTPVSAWRLTASATVRMTAETSRMSPDTARVSKMNIHSMTRVTDCPCQYRRYFFAEQWSSSGTALIVITRIMPTKILIISMFVPHLAGALSVQRQSVLRIVTP